MVDTKISALPAVVTPALTDEFEVNQAGTSKKLTREQMMNAERYMLRQDGTRVLTSTTNEQALFGSPDDLTLPVGTYRFESLILLTAMSATSGNLSLRIVGAGTAVTDAWLWHANGVDNSSPLVAAARGGSGSITQASQTNILTPGSGTGAIVETRGMFEVTTGGTIIPSVALSTAATPTVAIGTYFLAERISTSTTLTSL